MTIPKNLNLFNEKIASISGTKIDLKSILIAFTVIIVAYFVAITSNRLLKKGILVRFKFDKSLKRFILVANKSLIIFIGIFIAFKVLGINLSSLAVLVGFLSIGIGFGLQNLIGNLFSGLIIFIEKPIKVGDFIEINGRSGYVDSIRARSTTIVTRDNISIITPNLMFITNEIINWSHQDPKVRIRIPVGIEMSASKIEIAKSILIDIARSHPDVLKEPQPDVWFISFGSSTFNFELIVWIDSHIHENYLRSDINTQIALRFAENNIDIAYPYQNILLKNEVKLKENK